MFRPKKIGPRSEHREREAQRVRDSATLADRFGKLEALTVDLSFYDADGLTKNSNIKYKVNLANAKSVFRFNCPNPECVGGDFDLTEILAAAVARRRTTVKGEETCAGWRNRASINRAHCNNLLRFTLKLDY